MNLIPYNNAKPNNNWRHPLVIRWTKHVGKSFVQLIKWKGAYGLREWFSHLMLVLFFMNQRLR